ncbi:MAG: class I SAM-dependent methyltransferase [Firmicutes bacterium]|nr:class I SAM-dependent methyltransferase [Bacillota bacterium]
MYKLQTRLQTICSLIPKACVIADVGTDHGLVSEFIVRNKLCDTLIVNDISKQSLQKAIDRLGKFEINNNVGVNIARPQIMFINCCGSEITAKINLKIDCAVIAGMGGKEILKIMNSLMPKQAVLSPQKNVDVVRSELIAMGYEIVEDLEIIDKKKRYSIMLIRN